MFLTRSLRNVIEESSWYIHNPNSMSADVHGKDQVMKLIKHCCIKNNSGSLSFFNNTLRGIIFMDYLLMKRGINMEDNIVRGMHRNWFLPNVYKSIC